MAQQNRIPYAATLANYTNRRWKQRPMLEPFPTQSASQAMLSKY